MSLVLSNAATGGTTYSQGTGLVPIEVFAELDGLGTPVVAATSQPVYARAATFNYTLISIALISEEVGIDWELSTDNITYANSIVIPDMDALSADQSTLIYARATFVNDGSIATGIYTAAIVRVTSIENPV